jgi:hypothetical protein
MTVAVGVYVEAPDNPVAADELAGHIASITGCVLDAKRRTVLLRAMELFQNVRLSYKSQHGVLSVETRLIDGAASNDALPLLDSQMWGHIVSKADDVAARRGYRRETQAREQNVEGPDTEDVEYEVEQQPGAPENAGSAAIEVDHRPPEAAAPTVTSLPQALVYLGAEKAWLCYKQTTVKGKSTKVPRRPDNPETNASSSEPSTWGHYEQAVEQVRAGRADGIGIALKGCPGLLAVDLDRCRNPQTGEIDERAQGCLARFPGAYVEVSVSGTGLHILGVGELEGFTHKLKGHGVEFFCGGSNQYITVSGIQVGSCDALTPIGDAMAALHAELTAPKTSGKGHQDEAPSVPLDAAPWSEAEEETLRSALAAIPTDEQILTTKFGHGHDVFVKIGRAIERLDWGEKGYEAFRDWCAQSDQFDEDGLRKQWASFRRSRGGREKPVTIRTVYYYARECGWRDNGSRQRASAQYLQKREASTTKGFINLTREGVPAPTCANARIAVKALGIECRRNRALQRLEVGGHAVAEFGTEVSDDAIVYLRKLIDEQFDFDPGADKAYDAIRQLCLENEYDPILEELDRLQSQWDGVPRIGRWLIDYCGAEDTPFNRAVSRISLIAQVRRARRPGCKFDQIIVLEGPEGTNKSTLLLRLAGNADYFSDQTILGLGDREQQERLRGVWVYEIADLTNVSRAEVEHVKAFASRTHDRARPAFGRALVSVPRRCICWGTTNNSQYLRAQTGNRRFWPVRTSLIELEEFTRDRDRLLAEAAVEEAAGASIVLPEELWADAAEEQEQRREFDPWEDTLANIGGEVSGDGREERVLSSDILLKLGIPTDKQDDYKAKRAAAAMRINGWHGPKKLRVNGKLGRGFWRKPTPGPRSEPSGDGPDDLII